MKQHKTLITVLMLFGSLVHADVLVEVSATMVAPSCNIHSEHHGSTLKIDFGTVKFDELNSASHHRAFAIQLSGCDFNKDLAIMLAPKGNNTFIHNGQTVLATSISGLGISFNEVIDGGVRPLAMNKLQRINPQRLSATEYQTDLQARLVNRIPAEQLAAGKFTSAMTILVAYD